MSKPTMQEIEAAYKAAGGSKFINRTRAIKAQSTVFGPTGRPEDLAGYGRDKANKAYTTLSHALLHCEFGSDIVDRTPDMGDLAAMTILRTLMAAVMQ